MKKISSTVAALNSRCVWQAAGAADSPISPSCGAFASLKVEI